jgi:ferric-dicitrate binding protein FerR (iron transport regulator)
MAAPGDDADRDGARLPLPCRRAAAAFCLALTWLPTLTASPAFAEDRAGLVAALRGSVSAQQGTARRSLAASDPVFVGDRVVTGAGARANLSLGALTQLRLGEKARVTIDRFVTEAGGTITLGDGALLLDREPASGNGPVSIQSSYALIAVRGTRVFAGPSNGVFGVFVARGTVTVRAAGREVSLGAGQGTDIPRRGAPPGPVRAWGQARIDAALAQVN